MKHIIIFILMGLLLSGCAMTYETADRGLQPDVPAQWAARGTENTDGEPVGWLDDFSDPRLKEMVREALDGNFDLRIIATRLENARAAAMLAGADRLPTLSAGMDGARGETKTIVGDLSVRTKTRNYGLVMNSSWEIDLWGRLKDLAASAGADLKTVEADVEAARLSLAAQVAKSWFAVTTAGLQLRLAEQAVDSCEAGAEKVRGRFETGIASGLDLRLSLSTTATYIDLERRREMELDRAVRHLQVLLCRYPDARLLASDALPVPGRDIPAGLPSGLLQRRPDILAARHKLAAADNRVLAAKKAFLPAIRLTGNLGTSSDQLKNLLKTDFSLWNLAGNLVQPVFQGGRLRAGLRNAEADAQRAWLEYGRTVLHAFREVEGALMGGQIIRKREAVLGEMVRQLAGAEKMAMDQYMAGEVDIITLLEARRRVLDAGMDHLAVRNARLQNRVDLYLALGGDFY